jgi:hypothetical protein
VEHRCFALWAYLVIHAWRNRLDLNPRSFGPRHKKQGYCVFAGTVFTAVTGVWLYWLGFVA